MFRASTVPIVRSYQLYTWQLVYFMQVMWPPPRRVRFQPDSPRQRPRNLHETYQLPRVQLITPDDGHSRCPKHVEFRDKKNFGFLMHLVGYLYEDYHDAQSLEYKVHSQVSGATLRRLENSYRRHKRSYFSIEGNLMLWVISVL
jgi:hypothetical protein